MKIDVGAELAHFLREDSRSEDPEFVLIIGTGVCGKTRMRHAEFAEGFVNVDAGDIFRRIEGDRILNFPGDHRWAIDIIGSLAAQRAIRERRNIVTEVHYVESGIYIGLVEAMKSAGYKTRVMVIKLDIEEAWRCNLARGPHNISAYYTDEFNVKWLMEAAGEAVANCGQMSRNSLIS
jgi:hypothetical protein